jgi:hypothetical protein
MLLPLFFWWRNANQFPDGGARIDQPAAMLQAFYIMAHVASKIEEKAAENIRKNHGGK